MVAFLTDWNASSGLQIFHVQVSKNADRKQELQAQLTRVEQQIKAEHDRRRKRANEQAGKACHLCLYSICRSAEEVVHL